MFPSLLACHAVSLDISRRFKRSYKDKQSIRTALQCCMMKALQPFQTPGTNHNRLGVTHRPTSMFSNTAVMPSNVARNTNFMQASFFAFYPKKSVHFSKLCYLAPVQCYSTESLNVGREIPLHGARSVSFHIATSSIFTVGAST